MVDNSILKNWRDGRADIIKPSHSPHGALVVLVKKKDGITRFCMDYRKPFDAIPIPSIDMALFQGYTIWPMQCLSNVCLTYGEGFERPTLWSGISIPG